MKTAEDYKDYILVDDGTENGGVSFVGETLSDFMEDVEMPMDTPMDEVNETLCVCGICPIDF